MNRPSTSPAATICPVLGVVPFELHLGSSNAVRGHGAVRSSEEKRTLPNARRNGIAWLCARLAARAGAQQSMAPTGSAFRKLSQRHVTNRRVINGSRKQKCFVFI